MTTTPGPAPVLALLVDGRPHVGAGHLGRSLAIAQAWMASGGRAQLVRDPELGDWSERYAADGVGPAMTDHAGADRPDVLLVDHYTVDRVAIADAARGAPVIVVDDFGTGGPRGAQLVVDQNLGATGGPYAADSAPPRVLTGPRYALLRTEVARSRPVERPDRRSTPHRMGVGLGGSPRPEHLALLDAAVAMIRQEVDLDIVTLRGLADLGASLRSLDLAATAAGSTVWELCLFGIPSVVFPVAANQEPLAVAVGSEGAAVALAEITRLDASTVARAVLDLIADDDRRDACSTAAWSLVDGRGARRVAAAARSLLVHLRRATAGDADLLLHWANDPDVRSNAFDPTPIDRAAHLRWLDRILADPRAAIWIASDSRGLPIGQVRVEVEDRGRGLVDLSVAPDRRGAGWSAPLLDRAAVVAREEWGGALRELVGEVLHENQRSSSAFEAADFDRGPDGSRGGRPHRTYARRCDAP